MIRRLVVAGWGGRLKKRHWIFLVSLLAYGVAARLAASSLLASLLLLVVLATGFWLGLEAVRRITRRLLWRLRNRLIAAYLLIGLVPVVLIGILVVLLATVLSGQVAIHLLTEAIEEREALLERGARALLETSPADRPFAWERIRSAFRDAVPALEALVERQGKAVWWTPGITGAVPGPWPATRGIVRRAGNLYLWARVASGDTRVTLLSPLNAAQLAAMARGLGPVTILPFPEPGKPSSLRLESGLGSVDPLPPAASRFDLDFRWATQIHIADWKLAGQLQPALLTVHTRISAVLRNIFRRHAETRVLVRALYALLGLLVAIEILALWLGLSLTRSITGAVHAIYEGTQRVRSGDFSHRIAVRGQDQLEAVARSFNEMMEQIAHLLAVAREKERIQAELEIAREVQDALRPKSPPRIPGVELAAYYEPARIVSGDYYDFQWLPGGRLVVAVADVAGKGISAALLMASLQSILRTRLRQELERLSPAELMRQLNEQLYEDTPVEKYATVFLAVYDSALGTLSYASAGHLPALLVRQGQVHRLVSNGTVVGAFPAVRYQECQLQLEPGDLLVCYTDGLTEPENEYGEMFGEDRLAQLVLRLAHWPLAELARTIASAVMDWACQPELSDDLTLVLLRKQSA